MASAEPHLWKMIDEVEIWRFGLDRDAESVRKLRGLLIPAERARADRFITEQLRGRFTVGRATLRILLAKYLSKSPSDIHFVYGSHEKPSVEADCSFNLSHSHGLALLAISPASEVGIDLEWIDQSVEIEAIAERFFTNDECADIVLQPLNARFARFFDLWCCKEAYLKAVGVGISAGLNQCRIVDRTDGTASIVNPEDIDSANSWRVHRFSPEEGFAGALCVAIR